MNRVLFLPAVPLVGQNEAVLQLPHALVAPFALEMSLLLGGLTRSLRLRAQSGPSVLVMVGLGAAVSKAVARRDAMERLSFELGRNQAEYVLAVLLRAHRDGMAEVNHVHVEAMEGHVHFDLTIMFELSREPMGGQEALKLMGD